MPHYCSGLRKDNQPCRRCVKVSGQHCSIHKTQEIERPASTSDVDDLCRVVRVGVSNTIDLATKLPTSVPKLEIKIANQRSYINQLESKVNILILKHTEEVKELNDIINTLSLENKNLISENHRMDIYAHNYKQLVEAEKFFDLLKRIRNKMHPELSNRRFFIEQFVKYPEMLNASLQMLKVESVEELKKRFFDLKQIRNELAHPNI